MKLRMSGNIDIDIAYLHLAASVFPLIDPFSRDPNTTD